MKTRLVLLPLPLQGHQTPMLHLANILYSKGFSISIIHTQFNAPNSATYPHFTFYPIPNSLSECAASKEDVIALLIKLNIYFVSSFKHVLAQILSKNGANGETVGCLITDAMWHCSQGVADSLDLPRIVLRTSNAACFNAFMHIRDFREKGYLSATESQLETEVPELPPLKMKDIPILGTRDLEVSYELVCAMMDKTKASRGLILNTFQELEDTSLSMIRENIQIPVFAIGPFHKQVPASSSSLITPDQSCISWLNIQEPKSVLYVSFGSIASINKHEFLEIAWGLVNSNQPFLWVVRPGLVGSSVGHGDDPLPNGFMEKVAGRGRIVKWAPQEEVLAHPAIGGFWTHGGWNSTLESICEGVPMLCLPCFGDQTINARYVTDVWRVGFRFENELKREAVEKEIRRLMVDKEGEEMRQNITHLRDKACLSTSAGESSYRAPMEEMKQRKSSRGPRLVLFPAPYQGHITPMMHLATLLHSKGFSITIIQARYNSLNPANFPSFNFHFLDDGLPENTIPAPNDYTTILSVLNTNCLEPFRDCLSNILTEENEPVACLIVDPMWSFTGSVTESFRLPRMVLRTGSVSTLVVYDSLPMLREKGYFPLQEARLNEPMLDFPPFKVGDLPPEVQHELTDTIVKETKNSQGLICNTFEELEEYSTAKAREVLSIPIFLIGPLHKYSPSSAPSIWTQDRTSISWLNTQAPKSVLYVSFGSLAAINDEEFQEIAWGLANSEQPFLWVVRPGLSEGSKASDLLPEGYMDIVKGRGNIVKWAPQLDVLSHKAIGGFWTHCGWNSTLESISEGVPMLCQPCFADQDMNARHVSDDWKIGLRLEKGLKRVEIERGIRKLMAGQEGEEMRKRTECLKEKASLCLMEGGSSYKSLESLTSYLLSF